MDYAKALDNYATRREQIRKMVTDGKPRSVVARIMKISRQRVYQLTVGIKRKRKKNGSQ